MPRQRKRPTVMPERASYGTARGDAGTPTSENPTGTPPEGEPRVWTERMLAALDKGVKGGKWYSLIDKLYPEAFLRAAFTQVAANHGAAGVDHVTITKYASDLDANLGRLSEALRTGSYRPQRIRRHYIPKPGSPEQRPLGIPTVQDRVVQTALRTVLEPIFERDFAPHSGACPSAGWGLSPRTGLQARAAAGRCVAQGRLHPRRRCRPEERLRHDTQRPASRPGRAEGVGRAHSGFVEAFLEQGVLDGLEEWTPEHGTPQGAVCSPLLSNIYLDPLDHLMAGQGFAM